MYILEHFPRRATCVGKTKIVYSMYIHKTQQTLLINTANYHYLPFFAGEVVKQNHCTLLPTCVTFKNCLISKRRKWKGLLHILSRKTAWSPCMTYVTWSDDVCCRWLATGYDRMQLAVKWAVRDRTAYKGCPFKLLSQHKCLRHPSPSRTPIDRFTFLTYVSQYNLFQENQDVILHHKPSLLWRSLKLQESKIKLKSYETYFW